LVRLRLDKACLHKYNRAAFSLAATAEEVYPAYGSMELQ